MEAPTKDKLLNAAQTLMMEKGFVATSVEEICSAAKVTKGSFFHYFKSKDALGKELAQRFGRSVADAMQASACCGGEDPLERVYCCLDGAIQMAKQPGLKGCLIGTFSQEISETHPELRAVCAKSFEEVAQMMRKNLAEAKKRYAPKAAFDPAVLADYFIAVSQGSMILMKAKKVRTILEKNLLQLKQHFRSLFEK